ncbi:CbiX/SirB N-terminal domain-containing protein, partial [Bacillus mycoides]|uniref:CbiX/SirB N-terminal domain-containing protein n=1 Tax=Bacillus mycoides TaxID=1405 RepID=UPI00235223A6
MKGIVYIGDGRGLEEGNEELIEFVKWVIKEGRESMEKMGFVEVTRGSVEDGIVKGIEEGGSEILIVRVVLFGGGHYKRDVASAIK